MPSHWLEARLSLLYKKGNRMLAMNYRPISVSIYIVLARLILDAIQKPINTALSDTQAGSRKGCTTSQQAMNLLTEFISSCILATGCSIAVSLPDDPSSLPHGPRALYLRGSYDTTVQASAAIATATV